MTGKAWKSPSARSLPRQAWAVAATGSDAENENVPREPAGKLNGSPDRVRVVC